MPGTLYALYLSRAAHENLSIGLAESRWGLTDDAVSRSLTQLEPPRTGLELLKELQVGDLVLAASRGPQPRVKRGGWADATLQEGSLWRVTQGYYYDTSKPWPAPPNKPNESYPHRFGIEEVEVLHGIGRSSIELVGMDAMHYSANIGGLPVPVLHGAPVISTVGPPEPGETDDPGILALGGDLDATVLTSVRREQRKLRAMLLGAALTAECSLCGRDLPVDCIRTAHIKKRSECGEQERRDPENIMRACTLGCDHLFELGYIYVESDGLIHAVARTNISAALSAAVAALEGRVCTAHTASSGKYFAWHRERVVS
jgi:hypothetical protein